MTGKRKAPDAPQGRRKRAAPTIDLTATEVPADDKPVSPPEPESAKAESPSIEEAQAAPAEGPQAATTEPPATPDGQPTPQPAHHPVFGNVYAAAGGGVAGAVVVAVLLAGLWSAGVFPSQKGNGESAQIAALQKQMQALQNRPPPAANGPAVETLRQTVRKLEGDIAKLPHGNGATAGRLNAIDHAMDSLNVEIGKLNKRAESIAATANAAQANATKAEKAAADLQGSVQHAAKAASSISPGQLNALQKQVASLEDSLKTTRKQLVQSLKTTREEIATQVAKTSATDKTARLALSAIALRTAVAGGHAYEAELKQAQSLGADRKQLAPLEQYVATGVPSEAELAQELRMLMPPLMKAAGARKPQVGFLARLQANAGKIVRISPINAPQGDTLSDVLSRVEVDAAHDDIAAALADLNKLPAAARKPARDWIAKVKARQAALAAARQFAAATARALGHAPGTATSGQK